MRFNLNFDKKIDWVFTLKVLFLKLRREFYITFKPRTIIKILAQRSKNICDGCDSYCCAGTFEKTPFSCENLKADGSCKAYHKSNFPASCIVFPLDSIDINFFGCQGVKQ